MSHGKKTHAKSCMLLTQFFVNIIYMNCVNGLCHTSCI